MQGATAGTRQSAWVLVAVADRRRRWAVLRSRVAIETLPEAPIAFMHWADKASQKRSEAFGKVAELPPLPPNKDDPEGQQELEIRAHLRAEEAVQLGPQLAKNPGRLMLYWPRTGKLERLEAAPPDARPLAWSRDHRRLLFASAHRGEREQLYEYHLDRRDLRPLTYGPDEHPRGDYGAGRAARHARAPSRLGRSAPPRARSSCGRSARPRARPIADKVPPGTLRLTPAGDRIVYEQVVPRPRSDGPTQYDSFIATRAARGGLRGAASARRPGADADPGWRVDRVCIVVDRGLSTAAHAARRDRPGGDQSGNPRRAHAHGFARRGIRRLHRRRRRQARSGRSPLRRPGGARAAKDGWSEFPVW